MAPARSTVPSADPAWWRQAAIYQVYPRSFADGDGDGIGDLTGVLAHVDHLASLHVDAVWFSPFYPSALADGGYDVDDYRAVDPTIGTLEQFDQVTRALHARGIRVVVDIVPNHSSDRHAWFRAALAAGPGSPERTRYLFRDGAGPSGDLPPNDWQSLFGGPAWTRVTEPDGTPGQWYLHLFTRHQPDWDWTSPDVRADFLTTLRFWADRGVDGFRVDIAMGLAKDLSEPYAPWTDLADGLGGGTSTVFPAGQHPLFDRDELTEIYAGWRAVFDSYQPPLFAVAEAWVPPDRRPRYASPRALGQAFSVDLLTAPWDAAAFARTIRTNLDLAQQSASTSTWVLSNHDVVRHVTRYAGDQTGRVDLTAGAGTDLDLTRGLARARAAALLVAALPGSLYVYQGEELGLPEVTGLPAEAAEDPWSRIEDGVVVAGRDGCRVPLPWTTRRPAFGFSTAAAHLPQPDWFAGCSVEAQEDDPTSILTLYRTALRTRRALQTEERAAWLDLGPQVVAFVRPNGWLSVTNFGPDPLPLPAGEVVLRSDRAAAGDPLPTDSTAWLLAPRD
ncbi:MAG TPA: glycoside hydrolase family 13 protein [Cellulomonas sp.]